MSADDRISAMFARMRERVSGPGDTSSRRYTADGIDLWEQTDEQREARERAMRANPTLRPITAATIAAKCEQWREVMRGRPVSGASSWARLRDAANLSGRRK